MRINQFVARASGLSRRASDAAISSGRVTVNGQIASLGQQVSGDDSVTLDGRAITTDVNTITIMLNKPVGYVCSRNGQGGKTIYDLLPPEYKNLKPVGRLDKDSSGLLLLTNDGQLAQELTHPKYQKQKIYEIELDKPLAPLHRQMISDHGIMLDDGPSKFQIERLNDDDELNWEITMSEGRNRQIRRTLYALGYTVTRLHRTHFGDWLLEDLKPSKNREL